MDQTTALLVLILALGVFGRNDLVMWTGAMAILLRLLAVEPLLLWLEAYGIPIGLTFLTLAVLAPLASGRMSATNVVADLTSVDGILSMLGGTLAAWVCARGVELLSVNPRIVLGLMAGTIIGATFFKGIPVGPLFAAGLAAVFLFIARAFGL